MEQKLSLSGDFVVETRTKEGEVIAREEKHNLIVTMGKVEVAKLIGGVAADAFNAIAIGEGVTEALVAQEALVSEVEREAVTGAYEATAKIVFEKTFEFGSAETYDITEAGIVNNIAVGGDMLNRVVFTAKAVDFNTDLYVKFTITVS
jgi:hypothetical protein